MNGVHDLGGMHGFGPIAREVDEPVFHAEWEAHVLALQRLIVGQGYFHLDAFRYGIERMDPAHYLRSTYYERWLTTIEHNLIQTGILTPEELDARTEYLRSHPDAAPSRPDNVAPPAQSRTYGEHPLLPQLTPRFAVGATVVTRNVHPAGHTRLPRYARGKQGVVHLVHGPEVFPDTNAHNLGDNPQVVYNVRFDALALWGASAEPRQLLYIDLWESYLEPASS
ncbi:MAG: nitrile hydratase subunit beta [Thermomicrobiales bacterium]